MTTVQNTLVAPDETPLEGAYIEARLHAPTPNASAYTDVSTEILDRAVTHSAADGTWSLDLTPNSSISPANTFYVVVTRFGGEPAHYSAIIVPDDGPVDLVDILVADPSALPAVHYIVSEGGEFNGDAGDIDASHAGHTVLTGTDVQAQLDQADTNFETKTGATTKANTAQSNAANDATTKANAAATIATNHINDATAAHAASAIAFTPTGGLEASDVQAAIAEAASMGGDGGSGLAAWAEDVTYHENDQVVLNGILWVALDTSLNEQPGNNDHWGVVLPFFYEIPKGTAEPSDPPEDGKPIYLQEDSDESIEQIWVWSDGDWWGPFSVGGGGGDGGTAEDVTAEDTNHRPLTGGTVQLQLDRADSLLRFTNPGGAVATFRGTYDPTENYYPGDAVQQFYRDTLSWFLFLCVDVPGTPEDGAVGEDLNDSNCWVGVCQEGWSGAIDLRASGFNPLAGNTNNEVGFDHSNGTLIAGSYTVNFIFSFGTYPFTLAWDGSDNEAIPLANFLASQLFGDADDYDVSSFWDAASWRVILRGNLSGIPLDITVDEVTLIAEETLYFDTDAGPSGQKLYVEQADGSWDEVPDIQIGMTNPIGVNSGTEGSYYVYGDVDYFGWVYRNNNGSTGWDVVADTGPPSVGGSGPPTEPVYMTMSTVGGEQSTRGGISAPIGSTLRLQREDGDVGTFWVKSGEADDIWTPMPLATQPYNFRGAFSPDYIEDQPYTFGDVITFWEEDNGQRLLLCKGSAVDSTPSPGESGEDDPNWEWLSYPSNPVIMQAGFYEDANEYPYNGDRIAKISMYANGGSVGTVTLHFILGETTASDAITIDVADTATTVLAQIQALFDFSVGLSQGVDEEADMAGGYMFDFFSEGESVVTVFESTTMVEIEPLLVVEQEGARTGIDAPLGTILIIQNFQDTPMVLFHNNENPDDWTPLPTIIPVNDGPPDDLDFPAPGVFYYDDEANEFYVKVAGSWEAVGGGFSGDASDINASDGGHTYMTGDSIQEQLDQADARFVEVGGGGAGDYLAALGTYHNTNDTHVIGYTAGTLDHSEIVFLNGVDLDVVFPDITAISSPSLLILRNDRTGNLNLTIDVGSHDTPAGWADLTIPPGYTVIWFPNRSTNNWDIISVHTNDYVPAGLTIWDEDIVYPANTIVALGGILWETSDTTEAGDEPGDSELWTEVLTGVGTTIDSIRWHAYTTDSTVAASEGLIEYNWLTTTFSESASITLPLIADINKEPVYIRSNSHPTQIIPADGDNIQFLNGNSYPSLISADGTITMTETSTVTLLSDESGNWYVVSVMEEVDKPATIVLGIGEDVPDGTPAGTIVVRVTT